MYKIFTNSNGNQFIVSNNGLTFIPTDPANTDYKAYLAWVTEGNTAEEWSPENGGV